MTFTLSALPRRLRQRRSAIGERAIHFIAAYGVEARRVAVERLQREANWSIVTADVVCHSRRECGDGAPLGRLEAEATGSASARRVRPAACKGDRIRPQRRCPTRALRRRGDFIGRGRRGSGFDQAPGVESLYSHLKTVAARHSRGKRRLWRRKTATRPPRPFPRRVRQ